MRRFVPCYERNCCDSCLHERMRYISPGDRKGLLDNKTYSWWYAILSQHHTNLLDDLKNNCKGCATIRANDFLSVMFVLVKIGVINKAWQFNSDDITHP